MRYVYVCPVEDCEFVRKALDEAELSRHVARHEATAHRRRFDRSRYEDTLEHA
jgi:predicted small metal-binding protein